MKQSASTLTIKLSNAWRILIHDLKISADNVLRRAGLPPGLIDQGAVTLSVEEYARLFAALRAEANRPHLGLLIGQSLSLEMFDPGLLAVFCSPDLGTAMARVQRYKRIMGPFRLHVEQAAGETTIAYRFAGMMEVPQDLGIGQLVFYLRLIRNATRERICPLWVTMPALPAVLAPYTEFFGVAPRQGPDFAFRFSAADTRRPFLTANPQIWDRFEPHLRRKSAQRQENLTTQERVRLALLELLPSGRSTAAVVSSTLGVGSRTLHRRLAQEGTRYQAVLDQTREELARFYLTTTDISLAEISFLLGFDDPTSLFRAFQRWTGTTPELVRLAARPPR